MAEEKGGDVTLLSFSSSEASDSSCLSSVWLSVSSSVRLSCQVEKTDVGGRCFRWPARCRRCRRRSGGGIGKIVADEEEKREINKCATGSSVSARHRGEDDRAAVEEAEEEEATEEDRRMTGGGDVRTADNRAALSTPMDPKLLRFE